MQGMRKQQIGGGGKNASIWCFAGGQPDDICLAHGMAHTEVFNSAWKVADAMKNCESLHIGCPTNHNEQKEIAKGFETKSHAGSGCDGRDARME